MSILQDFLMEMAENNPNARLTYQQAEEVRERVENGERQVDIAEELEVSKTMISRIVNHKTYTKPPRYLPN